MELSDFIKKELEKGEGLTADEWVYKIRQFDHIQTSRINDLPDEQKKALSAAVFALYLNDRSDFKSALYCVVKHLSGIKADDSNIRILYSMLDQIETNSQNR